MGFLFCIVYSIRYLAKINNNNIIVRTSFEFSVKLLWKMLLSVCPFVGEQRERRSLPHGGVINNPVVSRPSFMQVLWKLFASKTCEHSPSSAN